MPKTFGTIEMKTQRGKFVINGLGQTNTGQKYIKGQEVIDATSITDPDFKRKQTAAVDKLLA